MQAKFVFIFNLLAGFGGIGLLLIGILDSSFLFLPLGNDLMMLVLTAGAPQRLGYYAGMASLGSLIGCALIDWVSRKGGEQGLRRIVPQNRIEYVKHRVTTKAGWALALAALLPPPFPFTPFVAAAAAFQYPRRKLFIVLFCARYLRFCTIGFLAITFGRSILQMVKSPNVRIPIICLVLVSLVGSVLSVWRWVHGRNPRQSAVASS